jgi:hypothetical protein
MDYEYIEAGLFFLMYISILCIWWRIWVERGEFDVPMI